MIQYQLFPRSCSPTAQIEEIVGVFKKHEIAIDSENNQLESNGVLQIIEPDLTSAGFFVEKSKKSKDKIKVPVLFSLNNQIDKYFDADALSGDGKIVIEVEAGRAVDNNQFLKDLFEACMMQQVEYLVIAVRNNYRGKRDFDRIYTFLETLYINGRLVLPLKGVVLIGY